MTTERERYEAARRNQATLLQVETLMLAEADRVLTVTQDLDRQTTGGVLRRVVPGLVNKYGMVNATAAVKYYDEQRRAWWERKESSASRTDRQNRQARAQRYAAARLRGEIYVARMPQFNPVEKSEPVIGWGMKQFAEGGHVAMKSAVTNALTRAVAGYNRDTLLYNSALDKDVIKVQRVPEPGACGFCRTMALEPFRVQSGVRLADYAIDFHNNCKCSIETIYQGDSPIRPGYFDQFEAEYAIASRTAAAGQSVFARYDQIIRNN